MTRPFSASLIASVLWLAACGGSPTQPPPVVPPPVVEPPVVEPPAPPPPPPAPAAPSLGVTKILAFGDSMTEGVDSAPLAYTFALDWRLPLDAGRAPSYPFKLKTLIDARYTGQSVSVYNGGFAGRQAREDEGRFSQAMSEGKPDLILLMEGANDLNAELGPTETVDSRVNAVVNSLENMFREAERRGIPVLVATLPPQRPGGPKAWGVELLPEFNDEVARMAMKKGIPMVDVAQLPLSFIGQDGLHPTDAGYQRIAEMWLDAIKSRYEKQ